MPIEPSDPPYVHILGVRVHALRRPELLDRVVDAVTSGARLTVLYVNVHCMNVAFRDPAYSAILNDAELVYCDGTGVRLAAHILGEPLPERMTGADWIHDLCRCCLQHDFSLFLFGGASGVADEAAAVLVRRYPGLRVVGTAGGFDIGRDALASIQESRPDILLVGMGTPRQEKWIAANRTALDVPVVWAVGALFDFVSGRIPRGPRWMTEHGLEWACRLAAEPRKLWRRYLIGNPLFLYRVVLERIQRRRRA